MVALMGVTAQADVAVDINLSAQRAYLTENGRVIASTPIASGRRSHPTPRGHFRIIEKDRHHRSTLYGRVLNRHGRVVNGDASSGDPVPRGGRFVAAPMPYFMRFRGPAGMHAGHLPGYAASHGCVRLPHQAAQFFFHNVQIGTPVRVFGRAP